jgi:hypothetical protein
VGIITADRSAAYSFIAAGLPLLIPNAGEEPEAGLVAWSADQGLAGGPGNNTWDRQVPTGAAAMVLNLRSIAGTGVVATRGLIIVEGY